MILLVVLVPLLAGLFLLAMERMEAGVLPLRNGVAPVPAPASVDSTTPLPVEPPARNLARPASLRGEAAGRSI
jgi:hypothetical protein